MEDNNHKSPALALHYSPSLFLALQVLLDLQVHVVDDEVLPPSGPVFGCCAQLLDRWIPSSSDGRSTAGNARVKKTRWSEQHAMIMACVPSTYASVASVGCPLCTHSSYMQLTRAKRPMVSRSNPTLSVQRIKRFTPGVTSCSPTWAAIDTSTDCITAHSAHSAPLRKPRSGLVEQIRQQSSFAISA